MAWKPLLYRELLSAANHLKAGLKVATATWAPCRHGRDSMPYVRILGFVTLFLGRHRRVSVPPGPPESRPRISFSVPHRVDRQGRGAGRLVDRAGSKSFPIVKCRRSRPCRLAPSMSRLARARRTFGDCPGGADIVIQDVKVTKDIARFRQAHREPEVASLRPREGPVRNCPDRPYQPETAQATRSPEGAAAANNVVDLIGGTAPERRQRRWRRRRAARSRGRRRAVL